MAVVQIMIHATYGGFGLSDEAQRLYTERGGKCDNFWRIARDDPLMVSIVKELGPRASKFGGCIRIVEIPARFGKHFRISEYDGLESVVIKYSSYRVETAKALLKDEELTLLERVERASAALEEKFEDEDEDEKNEEDDEDDDDDEDEE